MTPNSDWLAKLPSYRLIAEYSMWSANLVRLADDMARVEPYVDIYHIDVADGLFSPALLFFPDLVAAARKLTPKPMHVHLMVTDAGIESQIDQFAEAGADLISIHAENAQIDRLLSRIEKHNIASGIVLQLHTPVAAIENYLNRISFLTLLGTKMGIKGVGLDEQAGARLTEAKKLIAKHSPARRIVLAADGGIRENTVPSLAAAGAETIVMGSLAFNAENLKSRMGWVHAQVVGR